MLKKLKLALDPLAHAFNSFYTELLNSTLYLETFGHQYNLITSRDQLILKEWLENIEEGDLLDFGSGLGFCRQLSSNQRIRWVGMDFSHVAISYCQKKFPNDSWSCCHLPVKLRESYDYFFAIDSLYLPHPLQRNLTRVEWIQSLFKKIRKKAIIIQNLKENESLPEVPGWSLTIVETTQEFLNTQKEHLNLLQRPSLKEESKKFPTLWATISRENQKHLNSSLKRVIALYEKM